MDKEFLEECLAEGLSLEAIGKRVGKHQSTVSHWLKKHGLAAARAEKHAAKGAPSKEELERLLRLGMSLREIAKSSVLSLERGQRPASAFSSVATAMRRSRQELRRCR